MKLKIICWAVVVLTIVITAVIKLADLFDSINISLYEGGNVGTLPCLITIAFCAMTLFAVFVWSVKWKTLGIWLFEKSIRIWKTLIVWLSEKTIQIMKKYRIELSILVIAVIGLQGIALLPEVEHNISHLRSIISVICTITVVVVCVVLIIKGKILTFVGKSFRNVFSPIFSVIYDGGYPLFLAFIFLTIVIVIFLTGVNDASNGDIRPTMFDSSATNPVILIGNCAAYAGFITYHLLQGSMPPNPPKPFNLAKPDTNEDKIKMYKEKIKMYEAMIETLSAEQEQEEAINSSQ
jgi:hypothetical protein